MDLIKLKEREEALFAEWKKDHPGVNFYKDGLVDAEQYYNTNPKLLFVFKEAHDETNGEKDLRVGLRDGGWSRDSNGKEYVWPNWHVVARWAFDIIEGCENWWEIENKWRNDNIVFRAECLRIIGVVNLKKSSGGSQVDSDKLWKYVKEFGHFAKRQIELYKPDIIICGGTYDLVKKYVFEKESREEEIWTRNGCSWFQLKLIHSKVIGYHHYTTRGIYHNVLHYPVVDAIREIMNTDI